MLTIAARSLGRRPGSLDDWSIPLDPDLGRSGTTIRDVLAHLVRIEVRAFHQHQAEKHLLRVLTAREIHTGVDKGKVAMVGSDVPAQTVDEAAAVATALTAFKDGLFLVVIDEVTYRSLEAPVDLRPDSRIVLLRLALLAGG
jgi:hypothetical protein